MEHMNAGAAWAFITTQGVDFGLKILGAIVAWIVGRWLIKMALRLTNTALQRGRTIDPTLSNYLMSILGVVLNVALILAVLDMFGVRTTSFAALLAGAGLAIGTAWGGLLTHFAAGVFLQVLRPYKVGDSVTIGGVSGTVKELGLFGTTLVMADNSIATVGNNKVLSDTMQNFSATQLRRVDTTAKVANGVDVLDAISRLKAAVANIPNVVTDPPPSVEILQFTPEGPLLTVRPFTQPAHYGQVLFDTHRAIVQTFKEAGYPVPETPTVQRQMSVQAAAATNPLQP